MNRRNVLKLLAAASAGATLGHWSIGYAEVEKLVADSIFDSEDQVLIIAIVDTFIPKGDFYGALDLGVPVYLLGYLNECIDNETQQNIKAQLRILDSAAIKNFGCGFARCAAGQRENLLATLSKLESDSEKTFFDLMKSQTIQGFRTTKEVMTNHYHYRVTPGLYHGCINVNEPSIT